MSCGKTCRRRLISTGLGAVAGVVYHLLAGCPGGSCAISSSPVASALYLAAIGFLLGEGFARDRKEEDGECSTR